jgi:quercetin dioxygenase-like cupin family protein
MGFCIERSEVPVLYPLPRVERQVVSGENVMMVFFTIKPGATIPLHHHPEEQAGYVMQGRIEILAGEKQDKPLVVGPGTFYRLKPNEPHSVRVLSEEEVLVLDIFGPIRQDYLSGAVTEQSS